MQCPYCGKAMEKGLIQSPQEIAWLKGEKRPLLGRASFHDDSVVLSKSSTWKSSAVTAYLCRECKKVIINYAVEMSDFNAR